MKDIDRIYSAYVGRHPFHGELHDHTNSGGTSDGKVPMADYKNEMLALHMDFAAILDHRQVRHTYLPEFDRNLFICGTEPGTVITDAHTDRNSLHYNMLFPGTGYIEKVVSRFPEYEFTGDTEGTEGHFKYPSFTHQSFCRIIDAVMELGGFFVIPHPKQIMYSDDPLDYFFRERTGIEVFYNDLDSQATKDNYQLYLELLSLGKRIYVCAGGDKHAHPDTGALTTIYSDRQYGDAYIPYLRDGDFTAGNAGIRMILCNDKELVRQGNHSTFEGKRLIAAVSDLHESVSFAGHTYRFSVLDDKGIVCEDSFRFRKPGRSKKVPSLKEPLCLAMDASPDARFYRTELYDETSGLLIAMGNPIWNDSEY